MTKKLQDLVNEHAVLIAKIETLRKYNLEEELTEIMKEENEFLNNQNISDELKNEFNDYKLFCLADYERIFTNLVVYFNAKEDNLEGLKEKLSINTGVEKDDISKILEIEKSLFQEFFKKEKLIAKYLEDKEIILPENLANVYQTYGQGIDDEYTTWLEESEEKIKEPEKVEVKKEEKLKKQKKLKKV